MSCAIPRRGAGCGGWLGGGPAGERQSAPSAYWGGPYRLGASGWRYDPKRVGSWTPEEPFHFFDLGCWWLRETGRPDSVYARGARRPSSPPGLWDNLSAIVAFENGAHLTVTQSLATA